MAHDDDHTMADESDRGQAAARVGARNLSLPPTNRRPAHHSSPSLHSSESRAVSEASFATSREEGEDRKRTRREATVRAPWVHVVGVGIVHPEGCTTCDGYVDHKARHAKSPALQDALRAQAADQSAAIARGIRDALRDRDTGPARDDRDARRIHELSGEVDRLHDRLDAKNRVIRTLLAERDAARRDLRRLADGADRVAMAPAPPAAPGNVAGGGGTAAAPDRDAAEADDNSMAAIAALRTTAGTIRYPTTMADAQLLYGAARTARNDTAYNIWGNFLQTCQRAPVRTAVQEWATRQLNSKPNWARNGKNGRRVLHLLDRASWAVPNSPLELGGVLATGDAPVAATAGAAATSTAVTGSDRDDGEARDGAHEPMQQNPDPEPARAGEDGTAPQTAPSAAADEAQLASAVAVLSVAPNSTAITLAAVAEPPSGPVPQAVAAAGLGAGNSVGGLPEIDPDNVAAWQIALASNAGQAIPGIVRAADGRAANEAALRGLLRVARAGPRGDGAAFVRFATIVASAIESGVDIGLPRAHPNVAPFTGVLDAASVRVHLAEFEDDDDVASAESLDVAAWVAAVRSASPRQQ